MCLKGAVPREFLSEVCLKCSQCGVPELTDFLKINLPPTIFTANTEQEPLIPTKISIQISNFVIDINKLKNAVLKDMIIAKEIFPLQAYSAIEYACHNAELTVIRWGYWIRKLVGDNIICPVAKEQTISIFLNGAHEIIDNLSKIDEIFEKHCEFLKDTVTNVFIEKDCKLELKEIVDYIPFASSYFNTFYKCLDLLIYAIISFESLEHSDGTVYVGYPFNGQLKRFLAYVVENYRDRIKKIKVIDKDKLPLVEEFVKEQQLVDVVVC